MDNSFEEEQHVRCFNHTLQLSSKTLLRPFNAALSKEGDDESPADHDDDDVPPLINAEDDDKEEELGDENGAANVMGDDTDDGIDELEALTDGERAALLSDMAEIRKTVSKVYILLLLSFQV